MRKISGLLCFVSLTSFAHDGHLETQVRFLNARVSKLEEQVEKLIGSTSKKEYFCEIQVFTKTYKAFGPTELETKEKVKDQCSEANNGSDFHCKDIKCRKNE